MTPIWLAAKIKPLLLSYCPVLQIKPDKELISILSYFILFIYVLLFCFVFLGGG